MARYASGKNSQAISDISGAKVPYTQLKTTWNNLRVEPSEFDPKHPQLTPAKNVIDATALRDPRPSTDVENVVIDFAFTSNIFLSRIQRSQVGTNIHASGSVGTVSFIIEEQQTGVAGTSAIGTIGAGLVITGVTSEFDIGNYTPQDQTDVNASKVTGTTAIGDYQTGAGVSGNAGTGAIGSSTFNFDRIFELPNGGAIATGGTGAEQGQGDAVVTGVAGTGGINNATVGNEPVVTGVQATGDIGTFGEEGDGQLNLTVNGIGAQGTANAGNEIAENNVIESNETGFGENYFGYATWGGDNEIRGLSGIGSSTIDIFKGPNPQSGVEGTTVLGSYLIQGNLNVTGIAGTGGIGSSSFFIETAIDVNGVAGTSAVGTESVVIDGGFGEGTYGYGLWGI